jgi:hypothetical protein
MSLEGWIFMIGLRVFDVGGLVLWLVWFIKLREDDDDGEDDGRGGSGPRRPDLPPPDPGDLIFPKSDAAPWRRRRRDHNGDREPAPLPRRTRTPAPAPLPAHRRPDRVGR